MCSTSVDAYNLAVKLCDEFRGRKQREKDLNRRKEEATKKSPAKVGDAGPGRKVTEIDYEKHEQTVRELDRQEKEERFARKKVEASQWCTLDHEHGPNCRRPVGGCSHDHQKEWTIYEKSTAEKIAAADRFRQEGNEAYRKHNYGLAGVHYRKALLQFDYTFADNDEEEKAVENVKVPCLLNLAACKCQQEEWDEVLTQCRLALEINPRLVKAYYRTGQAHLARDQFDLAKDALMSAIEIEPQNAEVRAAYGQLKKNMSNYQVRRKEVFKEMMSGSTTGGTEASHDIPLSDPSEVPATADAGAEARGGVPAAPPEQAPPEQAPPERAPPERAPPEQASAEHDALQETQGLRQRGGVVPASKGLEEENASEDLDEDTNQDDSLGLPPRALNALLIAGVCLGVISIMVFVALYFTNTEGKSLS